MSSSEFRGYYVIEVFSSRVLVRFSVGFAEEGGFLLLFSF